MRIGRTEQMKVASETKGYYCTSYLKEILKSMTNCVRHIAGNTSRFLSRNHKCVFKNLRKLCVPSSALWISFEDMLAQHRSLLSSHSLFVCWCLCPIWSAVTRHYFIHTTIFTSKKTVAIGTQFITRQSVNSNRLMRAGECLLSNPPRQGDPLTSNKCL